MITATQLYTEAGAAAYDVFTGLQNGSGLSREMAMKLANSIVMIAQAGANVLPREVDQDDGDDDDYLPSVDAAPQA